jgi:polar amino acid transport system permease protein
MSGMFDILHDHWLLLLVGQFPSGPLGGLAITLLLSVIALVLAFPVSVLLAVARTSPLPWLQRSAKVVITVVRGVPLIMFIFWVYFFVPMLIGRTVSGFTTMVVTLVIYEAAYLAEVIRSGMEALPRGQTEAARALGLSYTKTLVKVTLPQAIYNVTPALVSQFVSTIKDTALGSVISVTELTFAANQVNSALLTKPFEVYLLLALIYFALCFTLTQFARNLEGRIERQRAGAQPAHAAAAVSTAI